jgi:integrase
MAHLCLTLFMFTACRISDAIKLGRTHEFERAGIKGLGWQPTKKGSAFVEIPMLPPLFTATRVMTVQGPTYLLTEYGTPFKSPEGLRNRFRKWCDEAGLNHLSSHGIRKATGNLLAQEGASQYQIMSIHGHTQAKTSEVYTKGVERWRLAADAMSSLSSMDW